ncbi:class I tRNA ligase family protein, partial [Candidatus Woesearchaeota archaeon]|nr:class I tRNA ligase family protein [Candidatus Woesearchaeota archaeon]
MTFNWEAIQDKWQKKWEEAKLFEANPVSGKKKFFLTAPYPYVNSILHIGHLYTFMRTEAFARFKRMQGYNVLYP